MNMEFNPETSFTAATRGFGQMMVTIMNMIPVIVVLMLVKAMSSMFAGGMGLAPDNKGGKK
jgi:hypothetical protein